MNINIQKSISNKRLINNLTFGFVFNKVIDFILWLILPICIILLITNNENSFKTVFQVSILILFIIISLWSLIGYFYISKLIIINKISEENKFEIIEQLKLDFKLTEISSEENILILKNEKSFWNKKLTVLFDKEKMFLNLKTLGRNDIESPFHSFYNLYLLKKYKNFVR